MPDVAETFRFPDLMKNAGIVMHPFASFYLYPIEGERNTYGPLRAFVSGIVNRTNRTGTGTGAAIVAKRGEKNTC